MKKQNTLRRMLITDLPVFIILIIAMAPFVWMILTRSRRRQSSVPRASR